MWNIWQEKKEACQAVSGERSYVMTEWRVGCACWPYRRVLLAGCKCYLFRDHQKPIRALLSATAKCLSTWSRDSGRRWDGNRRVGDESRVGCWLADEAKQSSGWDKRIAHAQKALWSWLLDTQRDDPGASSTYPLRRRRQIHATSCHDGSTPRSNPGNSRPQIETPAHFSRWNS